MLTFLLANAELILAFLFALHAAAVALVNLTNTPKYEGALGMAYRVLEILAGIVSNRAKELPGEIDEIKAENARLAHDSELDDIEQRMREHQRN